MKKIWLHRANGFKEAETFERAYYASMTPEGRLEIVQQLREAYFQTIQGIRSQCGRTPSTKVC